MENQPFDRQGFQHSPATSVSSRKSPSFFKKPWVAARDLAHCLLKDHIST